MKKRNITHLILTSSILLFSACSNKTPETPKITKKSSSPSLSAYNIIGIAQSTPTHSPLFAIKDEPQEEHFPIIMQEEPPHMAYVEESTPEPMTILPTIPMAMTAINMPTPIYQNVNSYSHIEETPAIEVISYASENPVPKRDIPRVEHRYSSNIEVVSYASQRDNSSYFNNFHNKNSNLITDEIEAKAKSFLGTKYVWGATGPSKFDCSGFTQWVYRDAGITIPRVSRDQAKVGDYVQYADLRRGDMVFFDTKKHPQGKVTHVGIYLGNNNFIHASSGAKKVVIYNFDEKPYYKKRFLWGRRVINNNYLALK